MQTSKERRGQGEDFFPSGAIAFFVAMLGFYAVLWLVLFSILANRS